MFSEADISTLDNGSQGCQNAFEISLMDKRLLRWNLKILDREILSLSMKI